MRPACARPGIYPSCFLYEHACRPNARLQRYPDEAIGLVAIDDIRPGDAVTFAYHDDLPEG